MQTTDLVQLARRQADEFSTRQAAQLGVPRSSLHDAVRAWDLHRPHRGVLALPGADLGAFPTRCWVALCAVGSPAWIGGPAALALAEIVRPPGTIDVVLAPNRRPRPPAAVRRRRLQVGPHDVTTTGSTPTQTVPRALAEVAALEPVDELLGAVAASVQQRCGDDRVRLDLVVRGTRVAIEVDGHAVHSGRRRLARDRRRQNRLVAAGWVVLRVDWLRMDRDPHGFLDEVRDAVAADARRR